jgi:hypothetical protein
MSIRETFSKRMKRLARSSQEDVYQYDDLPSAFRTQVVHILNSTIGNSEIGRPGGYGVYPTPAEPVWESIHRILTREHGVFRLTANPANSQHDYINYILQAETSQVLDAIEFAFQAVDREVRQGQEYMASQSPDDAIEELNGRFKQHGIGYQFLNGSLVRIDSQLVHTEAVKPALSLLNAEGFTGPAEEFMKAFEHHRHGREKEAIVEALKSFESTLKAICAVRRWKFDKNATARELVKTVLDKGLVPAELESHFTGLRTAMESGLPTIRNKTSAHGQGSVPIEVPAHVAAYALHLAASNIVFLVEAHRSMK